MVGNEWRSRKSGVLDHAVTGAPCYGGLSMLQVMFGPIRKVLVIPLRVKRSYTEA